MWQISHSRESIKRQEKLLVKILASLPGLAAYAALASAFGADSRAFGADCVSQVSLILNGISVNEENSEPDTSATKFHDTDI